MAMFTRSSEHQSQDLFLISSSDWESVAEGDDPTEAATSALEARLEEFPDSTNVSTVILAYNISQSMHSMDAESNLHILYAPKILANAGLHEESKNLQHIIDEITVLNG
jgi:hypothetical protein